MKASDRASGCIGMTSQGQAPGRTTVVTCLHVAGGGVGAPASVAEQRPHLPAQDLEDAPPVIDADGGVAALAEAVVSRQEVILPEPVLQVQRSS